MSRRLVATALVAASLLPWMPVTHADTPPAVEVPRAACDLRVNDDESDAVPDYSPVAGQKIQPSTTSVDSLDIKNIDLRITATKFEVYLHLKDLVKESAMPAQHTAYEWIVTFKQGAHTFNADYAIFNPNSTSPQDIRPTTLRSYPLFQMDGNTNLASKQASYSDTLDYIIWTADRSEVETKLGGALVDGDQFNTIYAKAKLWTGPVFLGQTTDETTVTGDAATYTVGNDFCFGPPPAEWGDVVVPAVQFTDTSRIVATLQSDAGDALPGKTVQLTVAGEPGMPKTVTTNADGDAIFNFVPTQGAGTYDVTINFPGDTTDGKVKWPGKITVSKEVTKFNTLTYTKPSATSRVVTATLLDNDNHAVAGQKVDWYVNGKKVATLTTDSKGKTILKTAKPGQTVYAKFLGVTNKFLPITSKSIKLG